MQRQGRRTRSTATDSPLQVYVPPPRVRRSRAPSGTPATTTTHANGSQELVAENAAVSPGPAPASVSATVPAPVTPIRSSPAPAQAPVTPTTPIPSSPSFVDPSPGSWTAAFSPLVPSPSRLAAAAFSPLVPSPSRLAAAAASAVSSFGNSLLSLISTPVPSLSGPNVASVVVVPTPGNFLSSPLSPVRPLPFMRGQQFGSGELLLTPNERKLVMEYREMKAKEAGQRKRAAPTDHQENGEQQQQQQAKRRRLLDAFRPSAPVRFSPMPGSFPSPLSSEEDSPSPNRGPYAARSLPATPIPGRARPGVSNQSRASDVTPAPWHPEPHDWDTPDHCPAIDPATLRRLSASLLKRKFSDEDEVPEEGAVPPAPIHRAQVPLGLAAVQRSPSLPTGKRVCFGVNEHLTVPRPRPAANAQPARPILRRPSVRLSMAGTPGRTFAVPSSSDDEDDDDHHRDEETFRNTQRNTAFRPVELSPSSSLGSSRSAWSPWRSGSSPPSPSPPWSPPSPGGSWSPPSPSPTF
ncbi:MAG: hypothetical protein M1823_003124 [Watsoniomyces obsoletus]|nr:MAG: hypothetical protein M1823_003124 [Watsoniomyces obsoletus]